MKRTARFLIAVAYIRDRIIIRPPSASKDRARSTGLIARQRQGEKQRERERNVGDPLLKKKKKFLLLVAIPARRSPNDRFACRIRKLDTNFLHEVHANGRVTDFHLARVLVPPAITYTPKKTVPAPF